MLAFAAGWGMAVLLQLAPPMSAQLSPPHTILYGSETKSADIPTAQKATRFKLTPAMQALIGCGRICDMRKAKLGQACTTDADCVTGLSKCGEDKKCKCIAPCDNTKAMQTGSIMRKLSASLDRTQPDKTVMFATSTQTLQGNGFEDPRRFKPYCNNDELACIPSPCGIIDMSYFNDPNSKYDVEEHDTIVTPDDTDTKLRNFEVNDAEKHLSIIGHSQCDPQAGTELYEYDGSIDKFVINPTPKKDNTPAARQAMQRLGTEKRKAEIAFGNTGLPLWPDTIPVPPVFVPGDPEVNPHYMFCPDGLNSPKKICGDYKDYVVKSNTVNALATPPRPEKWTCNQGTRPPPIVWIVPRIFWNFDPAKDTRKFFFRVAMRDANAEQDAKNLAEMHEIIKGDLKLAGTKRLQTLLAKKKADDLNDADFKKLLNDKFAYTLESLDELDASRSHALHPLLVRCRGSLDGKTNPHSRDKFEDDTGIDDTGMLEITNCYKDGNNHQRMFFGTLATPYIHDFTPVLVFPQMPVTDADGNPTPEIDSVPGAFSKYAQIVGIIFRPQKVNALLKKKGASAFEEDTTQMEEMYSLLTQKDTYFTKHIVELDQTKLGKANIQRAIEYRKDSCHVFSTEAINHGGCSWLPKHVPPGVCLDVRATRQQDMMLLATSAEHTPYGSGYGLLDFDNYVCANLHITPLPNLDYNDDKTLQHSGPLTCMRGRAPADGKQYKHRDRVVYAGVSSIHPPEKYQDIKDSHLNANRYLFRFSSLDYMKTLPRYRDHSWWFMMEGTGVTPFAIKADMNNKEESVVVIQTTSKFFFATNQHVSNTYNKGNRPKSKWNSADTPRYKEVEWAEEHCSKTHLKMGGYGNDVSNDDDKVWSQTSLPFDGWTYDENPANQRHSRYTEGNPPRPRTLYKKYNGRNVFNLNGLANKNLYQELHSKKCKDLDPGNPWCAFPRYYCDYTQLPTDSNTAADMKNRPKMWLGKDRSGGRLLLEPVVTQHHGQMVCPKSRCASSKYGDEAYDAEIIPWAGLVPSREFSRPATPAEAYAETACVCCAMGHLTKPYTYKKGSTTYTALDKTPDCTHGGYRDYFDKITNNVGDPFKLLNGDALRCICEDDYGVILTDLSYGDDKLSYDTTDHHSLYMSTGKFEFTGEEEHIQMQWHWRDSAFVPSILEASEKNIHSQHICKLFGAENVIRDATQFGVGSNNEECGAKVQAGKYYKNRAYGNADNLGIPAKVVLCSDSDAGPCKPDEAVNKEAGFIAFAEPPGPMELLLGPGSTDIWFDRNELANSKIFGKAERSLFMTNFGLGTKLQHTFPELIPYDGISFSRLRTWTSSVEPGNTCDCKNKKPVFTCFDDTIADAEQHEKAMLQPSIAKFIEAATARGLSASDIEAAKQSLMFSQCGMMWDGDDTKDNEFGLHMYGKVSPFYVWNTDVFGGDSVHYRSLAAIMGSEVADPNDLGEFVLSNPDAMTKYAKEAPMKFPNSCLKWPYGQVHMGAFSEKDRDTLYARAQSFHEKTQLHYRTFEMDTVIKYCDTVDFSDTGAMPDAASSIASKMVYCTNDYQNATMRQNFCRNNQLASHTIGGLKIDVVPVSSMCNRKKICLYVPGSPKAPTLKTFLEAIDGEDAVVLVTPFTFMSMHSGWYDVLYRDGSKADAQPSIVENIDGKQASNVNLGDARNMDIRNAFGMLAFVADTDTKETIMAAMAAAFTAMCPQGRTGKCFAPAVPNVKNAQMTYTEVQSALVAPGLLETDIRIDAPGLTIQSAVESEPLLFDKVDEKTATHTRLQIGAPRVTVGHMQANQAGCERGFRCAAVVFSGNDVRGSQLLHLRADNTDVSAMVLGRDSTAFGSRGLGDIEADNVLVRVEPDDTTTMFALGIAAANGTVTVGCSKNSMRCSVLMQPTFKDIIAARFEALSFAYAGIKETDPVCHSAEVENQLHSRCRESLTAMGVYDMSEATGLFGAEEERVVFSRPVDHRGMSVIGAITLAVLVGTTLLLHGGLFLESKTICVWLVSMRVRGKSLAAAPADTDWSVRWSTQYGDWVVYINGKQHDLAVVVITRIVCNLEGKACNGKGERERESMCNAPQLAAACSMLTCLFCDCACDFGVQGAVTATQHIRVWWNTQKGA